MEVSVTNRRFSFKRDCVYAFAPILRKVSLAPGTSMVLPFSVLPKEGTTMGSNCGFCPLDSLTIWLPMNSAILLALSFPGMKRNSSGVFSIKVVVHFPSLHVSLCKTLMRKGIFVFTPRIRVSLIARIALLVTPLKVLSCAIILTSRLS